jgi:hypothetical protein
MADADERSRQGTMSKAKPSPQTEGRISDSQYERELRELEAERDEQIAAWESEFAALRLGRSEHAFAAERHSLLLSFIEITGRFWHAKEEAYFRCCRRNRHLLPRGIGRPATRFRWFRTVPTGRNPGAGRRHKDAREVAIVSRAVALLRAGAHQARRGEQSAAVARALVEHIAPNTGLKRTFLAKLDHQLEKSGSETLALVSAVKGLDTSRFGRVSRAVSRALKHPPK